MRYYLAFCVYLSTGCLLGSACDEWSRRCSGKPLPNMYVTVFVLPLLTPVAFVLAAADEIGGAPPTVCKTGYEGN